MRFRHWQNIDKKDSKTFTGWSHCFDNVNAKVGWYFDEFKIESGVLHGDLISQLYHWAASKQQQLKQNKLMLEQQTFDLLFYVLLIYCTISHFFKPKCMHLK